MSFPSNFEPADAIASGAFVKGPSSPVEYKTLWQAVSDPGRLTFTVHNETSGFPTIEIKITEFDGTEHFYFIEGNDTRAFTLNNAEKLQVLTQDLSTGVFM